MLGKRLINTGGAGACTTDTVQILDPGSTQSTALYRFEDNANDTAYAVGSIVSSDKELDLDANGYIGSGNWQDTSGNNRHATVNGATYTNDGNSDYFDFNGSSDYAETSFTENWASIPFSVEMWFNTDSRNGEYLWGLNENSSNAWGVGASVRGSGNSYHLQFLGSGLIVSAGPVEANRWYHLVFTSDGTTKKAYLDGELKGTGTTTINSAANGKPFIFGRYGTYPGAYFNGKIAQVRIYSVAMSAAQVKTNYDATRALYAAYDGTASGVTYVTGKFGKAASFDGNNDYIDLPLTSIFGGKNTLAVSFWFKTTTTARKRMFSDYAQSSRNLDIVIDSGNIEVTTDYNQSTNTQFTSTGTYNDNIWHNLIVSLDQSAGQRTIYIDGSLLETATLSSNSWNGSGQKVSLGVLYSSSSGYQQYFDGEIDQLRIFEKALNPGEINSLYNETATSAASGTIDNPSTVAYYKMADASDETGSYSGTAYGIDFNVQGKYGFAGKFSGSSGSYIQTGYTALSGTSASISLWVNIHAYTSYGGFAIDSTGTGAQARFTLGQGTTAGKLWVSVGNGSASWYDETTVSISSYGLGNWFHLVGTINGTTVKIYINGSLIHTFTSSVSYVGGGQHPYYLGGWGNSLLLNGKLDQIRFFNKEISASEVTKLYNEVQCPNTINTPESYFNTKLYTGNGGTQALTGVGFAPDMTWIKARSVGYSHSLQDTLRGPGTSTSLYPDLNSSAGTYGSYGQISAFGTDGFTVASGGHSTYPTAQVNQSGVTYASWNWKAGGITNKSVSFSGAGSNIATTLANSNFTSNYSISFWVNLNNANTFQNFTGNYKSSGGYGGFTFMSRDVGSGVYRYGFIWWTGSGSNYNYVDNNDVVATSGVWAHLVATKASGALPKLYVNGTASSLNYLNSDTDHGTTSENFTIGNTLNTNYSAGLIDQVRVFNKEISAAEVTTLYNETSSTINTLQVLGDTSCIAAYPLGINANDLSTNYNGTANNVVFDNLGHLTRNNDGTLESTVSASQESGFSIVTYSGSGTNSTVGHGLSSAPKLIIVKRTDNTGNWITYSEPTGVDKYLYLNTSGGQNSQSGTWGSSITSTTFGLYSSFSDHNNASGTYVAYCFAEVDGYQRIGSYVGNGSANGPFVFTGFEPAWLLIKQTNTSGNNWVIYDNKRDTENSRFKYLSSNTTDIEGSNDASNYPIVDFLSNGFQIAGTDGRVNTSGSTYLFLAIAANPDTTAPTKANSFKTQTYSGNGGTQSITGLGFKPDFVWIKSRTANSYPNNVLQDSVRGANNYIISDLANAEATNPTFGSFDANGFTLTTSNVTWNGSGSNYVAWAWKGLDHDRNLATINDSGTITSLVSANPAAGFSIVTGTLPSGSGETKVPHGLSESPDIVIAKTTGTSSSHTSGWQVFHKDIGAGNYLTLNTGDAATANIHVWANTTPTSELVSLKGGYILYAGVPFVMYSWKSKTGYSKIGSYTGNGTTTSSTQTINVGFQPQFVMIKNSSSASTNWVIIDSLRDNADEWLYANTSDAAYDDSNTYTSFASNGFTVSNTASYVNANGSTYIYMAFK